MAAKFSFTRLRRNTLDDVDLKNEDKQLLAKLFCAPSLYLHSLQFIIVILLIIIGYNLYPLTNAFARVIGNSITNHALYISALGCILFIALIGSFLFLFGEIIPKAIALSYPEKTFSLTSSYAVKFSYLVRPLVIVITNIARLITACFHVKVMTEIDLVHSEEEIRTLVNHSHRSGAIDKVESELIENVFDFVDRMAKEVMVPRQEVVCLYADEPFEENMKIIMSSRHTRYPLCEGDKDHIIGLIHVKDIMKAENLAKKDLRSIKRKILVVPEVMKLSVLLQHMRGQRIYQSIVVDEYGGTVGLVGLEDIVEELVGDIKDENEEAKEQIVNLGNGIYDFDGTTLIDDVEDTLHILLSEGEEDTLGGYIFGLLGQTPELGDTVEHAGYEFTVSELEGYRIARVIAKPLLSSKSNEGDNEEHEHIQ